jgi:hypothetical protein
MDGRSRLSAELRFDPSNLFDHHQIGRRFFSLSENSRLLLLREIVSLDVCLWRRAAEGLLFNGMFEMLNFAVGILQVLSGRSLRLEDV